MNKLNLTKSRNTTAINRAEKHLVNSKTARQTKFAMSFMIRGARSLKGTQQGSVYMLLSFGQKRTIAFSTGISASPKTFSTNGTVKNDAGKTAILQEYARRATEFFTELKITGRPIDLKLIKAAVIDAHVNSIPNLRECITKFDQEVLAQLVEIGDLSLGAYKKLRSWNSHITSWSTAKLGNNARLDQILPADPKYFMVWLKGERKLSQNVASRIVAHLKRIMNFALENEWIDRNPLLNYRNRFEKKKLDFLTEKEIEILESTKFASKALDQLRDVFLFQCYTSLSYNELRSLTPKHIATVDGYAYIRISRKKTEKKTDIDQIIPLVPQALALLQKYKEHEFCKRYDTCFPVQSNQKFNAILKQISLITGIEKRLTSHVGRRTAATNYLNGGVPLVSVSAMLGHANTMVTQEHYTHIQPEMVVKDFAKYLSKSNDSKGSERKTA